MPFSVGFDTSWNFAFLHIDFHLIQNRSDRAHGPHQPPKITTTRPSCVSISVEAVSVPQLLWTFSGLLRHDRPASFTYSSCA